jgi:hypothetical protein
MDITQKHVEALQHVDFIGGLPLAEATQGWTGIALRVEAAKDRGTAHCVLITDVAKAFDSIQWRQLRKVLTTVGVAPLLIENVLNGLRNHRRSMRFAGGSSRFEAIGRGILQGDPVSMNLFGLGTTPLAVALERLAQRFVAEGGVDFFKATFFADDVTLDGTPTAVSAAASLVTKYFNILGMQLQMEKCSYICSETAGHNCLPSYTESSSVRVLGADLSYVGTKRPTFDARVVRLKALLPWVAKVSKSRIREAMARALLPAIGYDSLANDADWTHNKQLRGLAWQVKNTVVGHGLHAREALGLVRWKGHLMEATEIIQYTRAATWRRWMCKASASELEEAKQLHAQLPWPVGPPQRQGEVHSGPVARLCATLRTLGYSQDEVAKWLFDKHDSTKSGNVVRSAALDLGRSRGRPLLAAYKSEIKQHNGKVLSDVRARLRSLACKELARRRPRQFGALATHDVDRRRLRRLRSKLDCDTRDRLDYIAVGATIVADRLARHAPTKFPGGCPFCMKNISETEEHRWLHCEAWQHLRPDPQCVHRLSVTPRTFLLTGLLVGVDAVTDHDILRYWRSMSNIQAAATSRLLQIGENRHYARHPRLA